MRGLPYDWSKDRIWESRFDLVSFGGHRRSRGPTEEKKNRRVNSTGAVENWDGRRKLQECSGSSTGRKILVKFGSGERSGGWE